MSTFFYHQMSLKHLPLHPAADKNHYLDAWISWFALKACTFIWFKMASACPLSQWKSLLCSSPCRLLNGKKRWPQLFFVFLLKGPRRGPRGRIPQRNKKNPATRLWTSCTLSFFFFFCAPMRNLLEAKRVFLVGSGHPFLAVHRVATCGL